MHDPVGGGPGYAMTMHICKIDIDTSGMPAPTPEIEQERSVAVFDLLEKQHLRPAGP
jgi:uncharacterized protein (UPF0262 family)